MPSLVGLTIRDARSTLKAAGFDEVHPEATLRRNVKGLTRPAWVVEGQRPKPGRQVIVGADVALFASPVPVPVQPSTDASQMLNGLFTTLNDAYRSGEVDLLDDVYGCLNTPTEGADTPLGELVAEYIERSNENASGTANIVATSGAVLQADLNGFPYRLLVRRVEAEKFLIGVPGDPTLNRETIFNVVMLAPAASGALRIVWIDDHSKATVDKFLADPGLLTRYTADFIKTQRGLADLCPAGGEQ